MEYPLRKLLLFLLIVLGAMILCALIPWQVPQTAPAPAATFTPVVIAQPTAVDWPATAIPPTETAVPAEYPLPTSTAVPVSTVEQQQPPAASATPVLPKPLAAQPGSPDYVPAFPHMDLACEWAGAAGQVLSVTGEGGASNAVVIVSGAANGQVIEGMALAGSAVSYGPGGYEIDLSKYRMFGGVMVTIQVFDLQGQPLSEPFPFALPASCTENLALITFTSSSLVNSLYLPSVQ